MNTFGNFYKHSFIINLQNNYSNFFFLRKSIPRFNNIIYFLFLYGLKIFFQQLEFFCQQLGVPCINHLIRYFWIMRYNQFGIQSILSQFNAIIDPFLHSLKYIFFFQVKMNLNYILKFLRRVGNHLIHSIFYVSVSYNIRIPVVEHLSFRGFFRTFISGFIEIDIVTHHQTLNRLKHLR